jgi:hypothetical protein
MYFYYFGKTILLNDRCKTILFTRQQQAETFAINHRVNRAGNVNMKLIKDYSTNDGSSG